MAFLPGRTHKELLAHLLDLAAKDPKAYDFKALRKKMQRIAREAHKGQTYHIEGDYYDAHVKPVAKYATTDEEATVAFGHDLVEDTWVTAEYLLERGFPPMIVYAIVALSRDKDLETYVEFIDRIILADIPLVMRVKFWDNVINIGNNHMLPVEKRGIARRYRKSMQKLINAIDWDDPERRPKNIKKRKK